MTTQKRQRGATSAPRRHREKRVNKSAAGKQELIEKSRCRGRRLKHTRKPGENKHRIDGGWRGERSNRPRI